MAYSGFGIWALVAQDISNVCIDTLVLCFTSGWKPKLEYSVDRMKTLFSYGWKIMMVGVMTTLYSNLRNLIIGKKYTSSDLAFSEKGEQFPSAIAGNINSSITKVLFPVLSEAQNDIEQLKRMVRRSVKIGTFILFPILFGFAMIARPFVSTLLTEKWLGCVPFLQIMCIVYALQPLQTSSLQCIKALGKSSLYLWIDIIKKIIGIAILISTVIMFNNVLVIVLGALVIEIISCLILLPVNKKLIWYSYKEQFLDIVPTMVLTVLMCIAIKIFEMIVPISGMCQLVMEIIVGMIIYISISIVTKNENYKYILNIVKDIIARR